MRRRELDCRWQESQGRALSDTGENVDGELGALPVWVDVRVADTSIREGGESVSLDVKKVVDKQGRQGPCFRLYSHDEEDSKGH